MRPAGYSKTGVAILAWSLVACFEFVAVTALEWREQFRWHPQYLHVLELLDVLGGDVDDHVSTTGGEGELFRGHG